ncbi:hypothetical protein [Pseudolysinimonas kribbensis]|uniref:hypothetical protein n=1 Tax=Pseudolysinimonas kribbensis TaxID=433641 RepID=UPI0024E11340|nr:hypothetical protein [Pseudolysinimonas kribbensis]
MSRSDDAPDRLPVVRGRQLDFVGDALGPGIPEQRPRDAVSGRPPNGAPGAALAARAWE